MSAIPGSLNIQPQSNQDVPASAAPSPLSFSYSSSAAQIDFHPRYNLISILDNIRVLIRSEAAENASNLQGAIRVFQEIDISEYDEKHPVAKVAEVFKQFLNSEINALSLKDPVEHALSMLSMHRRDSRSPSRHHVHSPLFFSRSNSTPAEDG